MKLAKDKVFFSIRLAASVAGGGADPQAEHLTFLTTCCQIKATRA